ncbi:hypothetical protein RFI_19456, partial [Reticulomyxa filosa]
HIRTRCVIEVNTCIERRRRFDCKEADLSLVAKNQVFFFQKKKKKKKNLFYENIITYIYEYILFILSERKRRYKDMMGMTLRTEGRGEQRQLEGMDYTIVAGPAAPASAPTLAAHASVDGGGAHEFASVKRKRNESSGNASVNVNEFLPRSKKSKYHQLEGDSWNHLTFEKLYIPSDIRTITTCPLSAAAAASSSSSSSAAAAAASSSSSSSSSSAAAAAAASSSSALSTPVENLVFVPLTNPLAATATTTTTTTTTLTNTATAVNLNPAATAASTHVDNDRPKSSSSSSSSSSSYILQWSDGGSHNIPTAIGDMLYTHPSTYLTPIQIQLQPNRPIVLLTNDVAMTDMSKHHHNKPPFSFSFSNPF